VESLEGSLHDLKKKHEPNTEKENEKVELHHQAGLTSPVRQACREDQMEEEIIDDGDNKNNGYLPVANAICRRSARVRYPLAPTTATIAAIAAIAITALTSLKSSVASIQQDSHLNNLTHLTGLAELTHSTYLTGLAELTHSTYLADLAELVWSHEYRDMLRRSFVETAFVGAWPKSLSVLMSV
jgi:hypothetical protein